MTEKTEAMRLAQALNNRQECEDEAADELRRLSAENESLRQIVNDFPPVEAELREVSDRAHRLETQRDALLEACRAMLTFIERHAPRGLQPEPGSPVAMARAAIKAVEGEGA